MAFDYTNLAAVATRLISDFGRPATFRKRSQTLIDSARPSRGYTAGDSNTPVDAAFFEFEQKDIDGTAIQEGDQMCMIAASSLGATVPETSDHVLDGAVVWQVVSARKIHPGPTLILWMLQVRK